MFRWHEKVADGLSLEIPVLAQMAQTSYCARPRATTYSPDMAQADMMLDVDILARRAVKLAQTVAVDRIPGAMHDVFLSEKPACQLAFDRITQFVSGYLS